MRKLLVLVSVVGVLTGCNAVKRLTGQDNDGGGSSGPYKIAAVGMLPVSNTLTFTPSLGAGESLAGVRVRIAGVLTDITDTPSAGAYYAFDNTTLTIHNYDGASNAGGFSDNFAVYYISPSRPPFHTVS